MNTQDRRIFTRFKEENFIDRSHRPRPSMTAADRFAAKKRVTDTLRLDPDEQQRLKRRIAARCMP